MSLLNQPQETPSMGHKGLHEFSSMLPLACKDKVFNESLRCVSKNNQLTQIQFAVCGCPPLNRTNTLNQVVVY